jgi:hypothetical protein
MSDSNQSGPLPDTPQPFVEIETHREMGVSDESAQEVEQTGPFHWLRQFLACNPLYLGSAALLLYSFYLISADTSFMAKETQQLTFNLCSLQVYELLLVSTAIFLAFRSVWYDSTLLIGLENLLVLVPFILISQAALIDEKWVFLLSGAAGLLAVLRTGVLKRFIPQLNLPPRMIGVGLGFISINLVLPILYRILHTSKVGTKPDWGAAYETNQYIWWLLVPALVSVIYLIPFSRRDAQELWPERYWLPAGLFSLWFTGTAVHLYCLGYVYDFSLRPELLAPGVWCLAWMLYVRFDEFVPQHTGFWSNAILVPPAAATLIAAPQIGKGVFLVLTVLNLVIYLALFASSRRVILLHLTLGSVVALVAGVPDTFMPGWVPQLARDHLWFAAALSYGLVWIGFTRSPKLALMGALMAGLSLGNLLDRPDAVHWAFQVGLVYLLINSLPWTDSMETGEVAVRRLVAVAWIIHSIAWTYFYAGDWKPLLLSGAVLVACLICRWLHGNWKPWLVPVAAALVVLLVPFHFVAAQINAAPAGLVAVVGSFLLFALGTVGALTKRHWHSSEGSPS